jgi:hypothetical protein
MSTTNTRLSGRIARPDGHAPANLPILGKIKIGMKVATSNGKERPTSLDWFRCTGRYEALFHKVYGDKPASITVVFHSDDFSQVANERLELRDKAGRLVASSDGVTVRHFDTATGVYQWTSVRQERDIMERLERQNNGPKGWEAVLTLRFLLPKIPSVFGAWELSTKGEASSIPAIIGTLASVQDVSGTIVGVPMDLVVEKVSSQKPDSKSNYPVLRLIPNLSQENLEDLRGLLESGVAAVRKLSVYTPERLKALAQGAEEQPKALAQGQVEIEPIPALPKAKVEPKPPTQPKPELHPSMTTEQYQKLADLYPHVPKQWSDEAIKAAMAGKLDSDVAMGALLTKFELCVQACTILTNAVNGGWIQADAADALHRQITSLSVKPTHLKSIIDLVEQSMAQDVEVDESDEQNEIKTLEGEVTV